MKRVIWLIVVAVLTTNCQSESNSKNSSRTEEITSDSVETILSVETSEVIAKPMLITSTPAGFALYDNGLHQIQLFTESGNHILSFGNEGRGPGEFLSVSTIKSYSDQIIVSDSKRLLQYSFNMEGELISTFELSSAMFAIDNEVVSPSAFISPTNGLDNSLATFIDREKGIEFTFGESVVQPPEAADFNRWQNDLSEGRVPDYFRNRVGISAGDSYIYLFLQTEGVLRQYDLKGQLNWERSFDLPEFTDEFDRFIRENKDNNPGEMYMLQYVHEMEQDEHGLYMLLRIPDRYPTTILFLDHSSENMQLYRFPNIEHRPSHFSISPDNEWVCFLNTSRGIVYRSNWPAEKL